LNLGCILLQFQAFISLKHSFLEVLTHKTTAPKYTHHVTLEHMFIHYLIQIKTHIFQLLT